MEKKNFSENALCYVNQAYLSTVKNDELAIYNNNFIIGQMVVAANQPCNSDKYVCKNDEVKLITCLHVKLTGQINGLAMRLAYIVLRASWKNSFLIMVFMNKNQLFFTLFLKKRFPMCLFPLALKSTSVRV